MSRVELGRAVWLGVLIVLVAFAIAIGAVLLSLVFIFS